MTRNSILLKAATSYLALALMVFLESEASAQDARVYDTSGALDSRTLGAGLDKRVRYGADCSSQDSMAQMHEDVFKPGRKRKTKSKLARKSADLAIEGGYNYAIVRPLERNDQVIKKDVVRYGWGQAEKRRITAGTNTVITLGCFAVDDLLAAEILFDANSSVRLGTQDSLVDLRQFREVMGGERATAPVAPAVNAARVEAPGDKERLDRIKPLLARALACRTDLRPTDQDNFLAPLGARDEAAEQSCLAPLEAEAKAVGFTALTSAPTSQGSGYRGYSLGGGAEAAGFGSGAKAVDENGAVAMDPLEWGKGWKNHSARFSNLDGMVMMRGESISRDLLVASNTLTDVEMLDFAVYLAAEHAMPRSSSNGAVVRDYYSENLEQNYMEMVDKLSERQGPLTPDMRKRATLLTYGDESPGDREKAFYRARDTHAKARLFQISYASSCEDKTPLVCADKVDVHNTLGPHLGDTRFVRYDTPVGYRSANRP